jgi:hypothetical protein
MLSIGLIGIGFIIPILFSFIILNWVKRLNSFVRVQGLFLGGTVE